MSINPEVLANTSEIYAGLEVENGKPYMPANGTEGDIFMGRWCRRCTKDSDDLNIYCPILNSAICAEQPDEWQYIDNKPICTAFEQIPGNGSILEAIQNKYGSHFQSLNTREKLFLIKKLIYQINRQAPYSGTGKIDELNKLSSDQLIFLPLPDKLDIIRCLADNIGES
jgi:hypothetical protein